MQITSKNFKEEININILQVLTETFAVCAIFIFAMRLYRSAVRLWRWRRVKKAGANLQSCIDEIFSNLPPRESELCKDCKHSEFSSNNDNLLCLNERSRHFGEAIDPEQDKMGFCGFERAEQINTEEEVHAIHHNQTTTEILPNDL